MKIISLLPAASEMLCDLGAIDYINAVSHECNYPELLKEKDQITSSNIPNNIEQKLIDDLVSEAIKNKLPLYNIDTDKLNSIGPDLIFTQGLCDVCSISKNKIEATLKDKRCILPSKTKIVSLNGTSFDEICLDVLKVGKIVNRVEIANNIVSKAKKTKILMSKDNINISKTKVLDAVVIHNSEYIPKSTLNISQDKMTNYYNNIFKKTNKIQNITKAKIDKINETHYK